MFILSGSAASPTGIGDSDELVSIAFYGGRAHPPGYPVYTSLLRLWLFLFQPFASWYLLATSLNALLAALTIYLVFRVSCLLLQESFPTVSKNFTLLISLFVSFLLLTSSDFLVYSRTAEVFAFQIWLNSLLLWLVLIISQPQPTPQYVFALTGFVVSMSLSHHQLSVLIIAPLLVYLLKKRNRRPSLANLGIMSATFMLGIFFASALLVKIQSKSLIGWGPITSAQEFFDFISRGYFRQSTQPFSAYLSTIDITVVARSLLSFFTEYLPNQITPFGSLFALLALVLIFREQKKLLWMIGLPFFLSGPLVNSYLGLGLESTTLLQHALGQRMLLQSLPLAVFLVAYGLTYLVKLLIAKKYPVSPASVVVILMVIFAALQLRSLPDKQITQQNLISNWSDETLDKVEANAVLVCFSDISCFSLMYAHYVEGKRQDIELVTIPEQLNTEYENLFSLPGITYADNPYRIARTIARTVSQKRPIYLIEPSQDYTTILGLDGRLFNLQAVNGSTYQLVCQPGSTPTLEQPPNFGDQPSFYFSQIHWHVQADVSYQTYEKSPYCLNPSQLGADLNTCQDEACVFKLSLWRTILEPDNPQVFYDLAVIYDRYGIYPLAKREYRHVLVLDRQNLKAQQRIDELAHIQEL